MEEYVDGVCSTSSKKERPHIHGVGMHMLDKDKDSYEHEDLLLPRSVLDRRKASFKAADEKWEKASTDFFERYGSHGHRVFAQLSSVPREHALCREKQS
jgi:hypothetical protein